MLEICNAGPQNDQEHLVLCLFRQLSPQDQRHLLRLLRALASTPS